MSDDSNASTLWVRELVRGDEAVVREFWERYGSELERYASRRIAPRLQPRMGPEDVVQSACRTFFRRSTSGEITVSDTTSLWRLLCAITLTKVRQHARFHLRQRRSVQRETPQEDASDREPKEPLPTATQPTPQEVAEFAEQLERLIGSLASEEQQLVQLRLEGFTQAEIAAKMQCSERTVRRLLSRVRSQWTQQLDDSLGVPDRGP